jgi:hypothetical protein
MGKYSQLKGKIAQFTQPDDWQQKIDKLKKELALGKKKTVELTGIFDVARQKKEALQEQISEVNTELEAVQQVLLAQLEEQDITSLKDTAGNTFFVKDDPYCSIEDRGLFNAWVKETGQEDLFSVNYQTVSAITKDALVNAKALPPGVRVFMKSSIQKRAAKG